MNAARPFRQKRRIAALWLLATSFATLFLVSQPSWGDGTSFHEATEVTGLILVFFGVLGRLWSILFIGAHKNAALVTSGPYSMTRNPLYVSSLVAIAGIGLMFGSFTLTALLVAASYGIFRYTALREADFLASRFGAAYDAYAKRTPLFWPNPAAYSGETEVAFSQAALAKTFLDCLFLIALFPLLEGIEQLQAAGYLTVLFRIP
ncbi:isoprenylcysteine carboxylmethyltransferase family protein [Rhizobium sp. TRM95111]|uniref:methyltransferase family protein n=1 Tax=Rhizobium alarense TaxID=2846851 RepID=UPI001F36DE57|nr:isoprenylcysteine carboxylmethyltransferase family protein [Rhizobium alarense]MCF3642178.1 isoprenylcysteine carboxylmethyltransferase family protein [Rhizobium alarense]